MRSIEAKRAALRAEIMNLEALINGRAQELVVLRRKRDQLQLELVTQRKRGMDELIRMCQTPCWRYRQSV
jgi:hypothetical protein